MRKHENSVKANTFKAGDTFAGTKVVSVEFAEAIQEQRDELLKALVNVRGELSRDALTMVDALIAKATGK